MYEPYDYQHECLAAIEISRLSGYSSALAVMASGLGKTVTMAFDAKGWLHNNGGRVLFLCHQNDILPQARKTFQDVIGSNATYGFYHGGHKDEHRVTCLFASFQTMATRLRLFKPDEFDYIVVDESHHSHAETYLKVIKHFKPKFLLGMTATPDRNDDNDIRLIYGEEIFKITLIDALVRNLLTPVDYRLMTDEIQLAGIIDTPHGRMKLKHLNKRVFVPRRDEEIASVIKENTKSIEDPRVVIFCSSIDHCNHLTKFIQGSVPIHSKLGRDERATSLEMFRQGLIHTILTVDCLNEGIDIPEVNMVIFLRSTASFTVFLQQLGRGLRLYAGKDKVLILDFVANCSRIKNVYNLWKETIDRLSDPSLSIEFPNRHPRLVEPITLNVDDVNFQEKIIRILDILDSSNVNFYSTWQEAAEAAKVLNIESIRQYYKVYKKDVRLPCNPHHFYPDFPGWGIFVNNGISMRNRSAFYDSWQEASKAAITLGIRIQKEYNSRYKEDERLPAAPHAFYDDFPCWNVFLGRPPENFYLTCQEASKAAIELGIKTLGEYSLRREEDPRLIACPNQKYSADWPGWKVFLGGKECYKEWKQASLAAIKLGITSSADYRKKRKQDPQLPSHPDSKYPDFPGWEKFLG